MYYDINLKLLSGKNTQKVNKFRIRKFGCSISWTRYCTMPAYLIYKFNLGNLPLPKLKSCWNAQWYHIWNRYINAFFNLSLSDFLNTFSSKLRRLIFFWSPNLIKSYVDFMLDLRNTNISAKVIKIWQQNIY